jgi:O-antigen ligase
MFFYGLFENSLTYRILTQDARLSKTWHTSKIRAFIEFLLNIVPSVMHFFYRLFGETAKNSYLLKFFEIWGKYAGCFIAVGIAIMLITPYYRWNNMYGFLMVGFSYFLFCLNALRSGEKLRLPPITAWMVVFFLIAFSSFFWSLSTEQSLRFLVFSVTSFLLVIVFVNSVKAENSLYFAVKCCAFGLMICSLYAVRQWLGGIEVNPSFTDIELNAGMPGRAYSFFENPNSFASVLVFFSPLMLTMSFFAPKFLHKVAFFGVFGLSSLALVMTYSRGGWLAFAFSILVLMFLLCPRWIPLAIVAGICALPFMPDQILNRFLTIFNFADTSTSARAELYSSVFSLIARYPIFGVGLGIATVRHAISIEGLFDTHFPFIHAHNLYMQLWAESGIFALIAFVFAMVVPVRLGFKLMQEEIPPVLRGIVSGCVAGMGGALVFGLTDVSWGFPRVMVLFWFLYALLCVAINLYKKEGVAHDGK